MGRVPPIAESELTVPSLPSISIVVPVYHNAASLPTLLERFRQLADRNPGDLFEFVFVDDGSKDDSFQVLCSLQKNEPRMRVIKLSRNFGSNAAIRAGLTAARGRAVAAIAADLQDPPELIDEMIAHWRAGKKVILAAREGRDDPWLTSIMANGFYYLFRKFAISTMPKGGFDFFLLDRSVCDLLISLKDANPYLMGQILWLGFEPVTLRYRRKEREKRYGRSMWTFFRKVKYFLDAFVSFSYAPVRLATIFGLVLSFLGVVYGGVVLTERLTGQTPVAGWSSLMIVILLVSGVQLLMLGIFGEYLWRNLDQSRGRPPFIIETEVNREEEESTGRRAA